MSVLPQPARTGPSARAVLDVLHAQRVTHLVGLPDNMSAEAFRAAEDSPINVVTVTREGEAFAIAAGLWIGGARPVLLIQNTGLLESGDALRGTVTRIGMPLVIMVTIRGHRSLGHVPDGPESALTRELLTRPDVDSAALMTDRTLKAWGVSAMTMADDSETVLADACALAEREQSPVAVRFTRGFGE